MLVSSFFWHLFIEIDKKKKRKSANAKMNKTDNNVSSTL